LTFIDRVASLLVKNLNISNLYSSHGDTPQNVHALLLTISVGSLDGRLKGSDGEKVIQGIGRR